MLAESGTSISHTATDYSPEQYGPSCVPSSIWRILETIKDQGNGLNIEEMKIWDAYKVMCKRLRDVESGLDTSATAKILLVDLVQFLSLKFRKLGINTDELQKIKEKYGSQFLSDEVPIRTREKLTVHIKQGKHFVKLEEYTKLQRVDEETLEATMVYKKPKNRAEATQEIEVVFDPKKNCWRASGLLGNAYLLADAVARGDKKATDLYLESVNEGLLSLASSSLAINSSENTKTLYNEVAEIDTKIKKQKKKLNSPSLSLEEKESLTKSINSLEIKFKEKVSSNEGIALVEKHRSIPGDEENKIIRSIFKISQQIYRVDPTRSGTAKAKFLTDLSLTLLKLTRDSENEIKIARWGLAAVNPRYSNMDVPGVFDATNPNQWVEALALVDNATLAISKVDEPSYLEYRVAGGKDPDHLTQ